MRSPRRQKVRAGPPIQHPELHFLCVPRRLIESACAALVNLGIFFPPNNRYEHQRAVQAITTGDRASSFMMYSPVTLFLKIALPTLDVAMTAPSTCTSPMIPKAAAVISIITVICYWHRGNLHSASQHTIKTSSYTVSVKGDDLEQPTWAMTWAEEKSDHDHNCWSMSKMPAHLLNANRSRLAPCVKYSHVVRALSNEFLLGKEEELSWGELEDALKSMRLSEKNGYGPSPTGPLANTTYRQFSKAVKANYYSYESGYSKWDSLLSSLEVMYKMEYADNNGFPIQISEAYPYLHISNAGVPYNLSALKQTGITHIISLTDAVDEIFPTYFKYGNIRGVHDEANDPKMKLGRYFEQTADFIDDARMSGGKVLVHCWEGKSRSATILVAYLISRQNMTRDSALAMIRKVRPIAKPNDQYMAELENLELKLRDAKANCNDPLPADARILDDDGSLADGVKYSTIRRFIVNKYGAIGTGHGTKDNSWRQLKYGLQEMRQHNKSSEWMSLRYGSHIFPQVSYSQLEKAVLAQYHVASIQKEEKRDIAFNQLMESLMVMRKVETDGEPVPIQEEDQRWQPRLFIGGAGAAYNLKALQEAGISHIISVTPDIGKIFPDTFDYLHISDVHDTEGSGSKLSSYFDNTFNFIDSAIRGGDKVLIHGNDGKSRSVAVMAAYLMKRKRIGCDRVLAMIRTTRAAADPENFVGALKQYGKKM